MHYGSPELKRSIFVYISSRTNHLNTPVSREDNLQFLGEPTNRASKPEIMFKPGLFSFALCSALFFALCSSAFISQQTALELKDVKLTGLDGIERDVDLSENKNSEDDVFHGARELNLEGMR